MSVNGTEPSQMDRDELAEVVKQMQSRMDDLEREVETLDAFTNALQRQNKELKRVIAGSTEEFSQWNVGAMRPLHDRIEDIDDTVSEHSERLEMFVVERGQTATPDERAKHLRQVLWNQAQRTDDNTARLTRDSAQSSLGGDLHKGQVIDAMRRAADGRDADIDGSSDLEALDAIAFNVGGMVGSDGRPNQSYIEMDANNLTGTEARQNLTTVSEEGGG